MSLTPFDSAMPRPSIGGASSTSTFTSTQGRNSHMIVFAPAFDPAKKYPLWCFITAALASFNPDQMAWLNYHLWRPRVCVLMTDYSGSTSFGEVGAGLKLDPFLKTPGGGAQTRLSMQP